MKQSVRRWSLGGLRDGFRLYSRVAAEAKSPGEIIYDVFGQSKGKRRIFRRNLICDWETLQNLPRTGRSTDETTRAFAPFVPQFSLNGNVWNARRNVLKRAFGAQYVIRVKAIQPTIELRAGSIDLYEPIFEACFEIAFEYVFGRRATDAERAAMLSGMWDVNRYIKRQTFKIDMAARHRAFRASLELTAASPEGFIFGDSEEFYALTEVDRASIVASDLIFSSSVQPADLACHMLLVRASHPDMFDRFTLDECLNETLRLYPLSDIYARVPTADEPGWIASLVQLNRNGWSNPDRFDPGRWNRPGHPPNMSWGVEARRCPASEIGVSIAKTVFQAVVANPRTAITFAEDFRHERTFPYGIPALVTNPSDGQVRFKMPHKFTGIARRWVFERKRMLEQRELW